MREMKQRIVLAHDGSPETSHAISWLARHHDADVVTLTLDFGGGMLLDGIRALALGNGAIRAHVLEVQDEFARDIIVPAAQAGAVGASVETLARPLLARKLVDIARIEKAAAVAYAPRGEGGTSLEGLIAALDRELTVIPVTGAGAAARERSKTGRKSLPLAVSAHVELTFNGGLPTTINGIPMRLPELLESLATIAGEHGIGSSEHVFMPAVTVLHAAYRALAPQQDGAVRLKLADGRSEVEHLSASPR
jgi:argininosuccinate synthase